MKAAIVLCSLLALVAGISATNADKEWYLLAGFNINSEELITSFDFRGIYDSGRKALIVASESEVPNLVEKKLFPIPLGRYTEDALYVARLDGSVDVKPINILQDAEMAKKCLVRSFIKNGRGIAIFRVPKDLHVEVSDERIELIRVASRRMRKTPSFEESPLSKINFKQTVPAIVSAVANVSKTEIHDNDIYLSEEFHTRLSSSDDILSAQLYLENRLLGYGLRVSTQEYRTGYAPNVIGELTGLREPQKIIVVGAHYDSRATNINDPEMRAPGADDNGSGSSALLELVRVITESNVSFHYTIRFVFFSGEEQGLLGSAAYAQQMVDEGQEIVAMFNADMLGYRIPGSEIVLGMKDNYITEWLLSAATAVINSYVPSLPVRKSSSCCSDYKSFFENGFPAIGFFENDTGASSYPSYHTSNDVAANLDFDQIVLHTRAWLATVMTFAVPL